MSKLKELSNFLVCPDCFLSLKYLRKNLYCQKCERKFEIKNIINLLPKKFVCKNPYEWVRIKKKRDSYTLDTIEKIFETLKDKHEEKNDFEDLVSTSNMNIKGNVLCLGAGICVIPIIVKTLFPSSKVFVVDIANNILEVGKKLSQLFEVSPEIFINASAESLPFKKGTFDFVISSSFLHHTDIDKTFINIYRVLKKGGIYISLQEPTCAGFTKKLYKFYFRTGFEKSKKAGVKRDVFSLKKISETLRQAGFKNITIEKYKNPEYVSKGILTYYAYYSFLKIIPFDIIRKFFPSKVRIIAKK